MNHDRLSKGILAWACYIVGLTLLTLWGNWQIALGAFLLILGNTAERLAPTNIN